MSKEYEKITIEAAVSGWVVTISGEPKQVFYAWPAVVRLLEYRLTSNGYNILPQEVEGDT